MSSPTLSAANSAVEEGSTGAFMSRASDAASDLGRRLRIDSSRDDMARTRGMAKKEEERQATSSSRAAAATAPATRSSGRSTRQAPKATAGSSSKAAGRSSRQQAKDSDDEDDSDDDDSDQDEADDDDDPDSDGEAGSRSGAVSPGEKVLQILSVFEPNNYTYEEMRQQSLPGRPESSINYRNLARTMAALANSDRASAALEQAVPIEGPFWSSQIVSNMTARAYRIFQDLLKYERQPREGSDVIDTVAEIRRFFSAVEGILLRFRNMPASTHQSLVALLRYVLAQIIALDRDVRGPSSSGRPVFAGGSDQHEHNLYLRFASSQRDWMHCLEILRRLGSVYAGCFRADAQSWAQLMQALRSKYVGGQWPNATVRDFVVALRDRLDGMQVQLA